MKTVKPSHEILTPLDANHILKRIEAAGRTCYKSEDRITPTSAERFVRMILKRGHESVIEHESISVRFICDRGISHELVRHRLASFSQESTRYCDYNGGPIAFIVPSTLPADLHHIWRESMIEAEESYNDLRQAGCPPEIARSVLPNSLKTEIVVTANLREWRHILRLRTSKAAHPDMRALMILLLEDLRSQVPVIFEDL